MNYGIEILPQALDNIETAYRWMANNYNPERAEQWYEELMIAVQSLERFPNRGSQAPEASEFKQDIRHLFVGKGRQYRLLFVIEKGRISILYVRHSSQSWLSKSE